MKWPWPEVRQLVRQIAVTEQAYYRWRNEYGGLSIDQARKPKKLELENARLRRAVADLTLDKLILEEAADAHHSNLNIIICRPDIWRDVLTLNSQLLTVPFCSMH